MFAFRASVSASFIVAKTFELPALIRGGLAERNRRGRCRQRPEIERHTLANVDDCLAPVRHRGQVPNRFIDDVGRVDQIQLVTRPAHAPERSRHLVDGGVQPDVIRREILRLAIVECEHDRREISRPEPIDDVLRDPLHRRDGAHVQLERRVVDDDDDQAMIDGRIRSDIRGDITHPGGSGGRWVGKIHGGKRGDGLRLAVFENREVRRLQAAHRMPIPVEDGHVELDEIDPAAKDR